MKERLLYKKEIPKFHKELAKEYNIYAPVKRQGITFFKQIEDSKEIILDFLNTKMPPKEIFFPKMEVIFNYEKKGNEIKIEKKTNLERKNIIFGIRPCDTQGGVLMENFFDFGEYKDNLFLEKRKNTLLFGIGCNNPKTTCFCTSLGGHPYKKEGNDLFFTDLGDKYVINSITEKGIQILETMNWLLEAKEEDIDSALKLSNEAELKIKTKLDFFKLSEKLDDNFNNPIWKKISETCVGCGSCSFLCPTCTCFDVIDEEDQYNNRGKRLRIWDTCQFCLYSLHTSGHNPRPSKIERCRNRILHKFCYYPQNYNVIGCVGCGRCIQLCPVNNDLRKIVQNFQEINERKKEEEFTIA